MADGIILINKEGGITSQGVVSRVKRLLSVKKAGHTGTLDPMATGILPILLGKATKAGEFMLSSDKYYRAELLLGTATDTEDITGKVTSKSDDIPDEKTVREIIISRFLGNIKQIPPMYSALKVGGEKLYELARRGIEVEREARDITIHEIDVEKISERVYSLDVHCSKGTYIRTLCRDIGEALGCGGTMQSLERTHASVFELADCITLSELEALSPEERLKLVVPTERVFEGLPKLHLPDFYARLAKNGLEIYLKKLSVSLDLGQRVRLADKDGFFAVGEVMSFPDGVAVKPIRQF